MNKQINAVNTLITNSVRTCSEDFIGLNQLTDPVDINIIENYTDFIVDRLDSIFEKLGEVK